MALELNKIRVSQINEKVRVGADGNYTNDLNGTVKYDIILPETRADLVKETFGAKANAWAANTLYKVGESVYVESADGAIASYECKESHTSGNSFENSYWNLIVSRRFVTPQDEINWNEGGVALKFRGSYSATYEYKLNDVVAYRDGNTGQEEYFISLVDENKGVTPNFERHSENWRNLNLWASKANEAQKIEVETAPTFADSQDAVYLTFVTTNNTDPEAEKLYTAPSLVYEVNANKLSVMAEYADKYMRAFNSDGEEKTPEARSLNDEFKAVYATIKSISGGDLVLGHSLTIQLNGETLLDNWMATTDANINIELDSSDITDWETAMAEAFNTIGNARYVRYDAAQELTEDQKAQARLNINAAPIANYPVMGDDNKIKLENLPDTVVGGLQYKGIYNASIAGAVVPEIGDYYIVNVAGNYDPAGGLHEPINSELTFFRVGDWAIYDGEAAGWSKIDNTDAVKSINGQIGDVKTYKGAYSTEANYFAGDWVLNGGILYLAVQDSQGQDPVSSVGYWQVAGRIYSGQDGIIVDGNVIKHTAAHVTETEEAKAIDANGGQFSVDINEYDAQGHVIKTKKQNITLSQTWREVKVGEAAVVASDSNAALNIAGNAPIAVEGSAVDHSIVIKHNAGTAVTGEINLSVAADGAIKTTVASSDEFGHVNGTRNFGINNIALKDGEQTLSGVKTYKNDSGSGVVIKPEQTEVYDLGSSNFKFANIYAKNLVGNADSASKWAASQAFTIGVKSGVDRSGSELVSSVTRNVDGSSSVNWSIELPNSGVAANVYSAVQVNAKGIVVDGAQIIEFAKSTQQTDPSSNLAIGGLFFRMVESN